MNEKIMLVDINSGNYIKKNIGYEINNFERYPDGCFYGYVPPHDDVNIKKIDAKAKDLVNDVLIVYVQIVDKKSNTNRRIVGYSKKATVYAKPQKHKGNNELFAKANGNLEKPTYCIRSDNLIDLKDEPFTFEINLKKYSPYMFRYQRSYLEKYPDLKEEIINYINSIEIYNTQNYVQNTNCFYSENSNTYDEKEDSFVKINSIIQIKRNSAISKKVLSDNNYICAVDPAHITFITKSGTRYMEANNLIPCTVHNSERFKKISKLDREENIVCLCPTFHRAVHYGEISEKRKILKILFEKQKGKLEDAGFDLSFDDLMNFYGEKNNAGI